MGDAGYVGSSKVPKVYTPEQRAKRLAQHKAWYRAQGPRTEEDRAAARAYYTATKHRRQTPEARERARAANKRHQPRKGAKSAERRIATRQAIAKLKEAVPCDDCHQHFPYYVMDFDHRRGRKDATVATLVAQACSMRRIMAEIHKCDLVCSNCHRIRTHKDRLARLRRA